MVPVRTEAQEQRFVRQIRPPVRTEAQEQRFVRQIRPPVRTEAQEQRFVRQIRRQEVLVRQIIPRAQADLLQDHQADRFLARHQAAEETQRQQDRPEFPTEDVNEEKNVYLLW